VEIKNGDVHSEMLCGKVTTIFLVKPRFLGKVFV